MGNTLPEGHNQLNNNSLNEVTHSNNKEVYESGINPVVNSIVTDLIESVIKQETIMSEESAENMSICSAKSECSDTISPQRFNRTIDEINESYSTPLSSSNIENSPQKELNKTCSPIDDFSPACGKSHEQEMTLCNTNNKNELLNESQYESPERTSPASGSSYSKLDRASLSPVPTSPSSWKYSSNGYKTSDSNLKIDGSEFDSVLEDWDKKFSNTRNNLKPNLSRVSLYRQFDPLVGSEVNQYTKMLRTTPKLNDSSDLSDKFEWLKINDSPMASNSNGHYINSPKPDVLAFAIEENAEDKKEQYQKYDDKLKEKDVLIDQLNEKVNESEDKNSKLLKLIETLHNINEELVQRTSQMVQKKDSEIDQLKSKCSALTSERSQALEDVTGIEKSFSDLHLRYDKLRNDYTLSKESESLYQRQYMSAADRVKELENICKELQAKVGAENNKFSESAKREIENELIAVKVQYKKAEMKINSLQNQLDQRTQENTELSSMVDELILKVRK